MLPGGGIDEGEDVDIGLKREIAEELGCDIRITHDVGSVETYIDRWQKRQVDACYIAHKMGDAANAQTDFEKAEGHSVVWAPNLGEAIKLVEGANPANRDGKLVRARDVALLRAARKLA